MENREIDSSFGTLVNQRCSTTEFKAFHSSSKGSVSPKRKFEYCEEIVDAYHIVDRMNQMGQDGWEAVAIEEVLHKIIIYFKREIQ